MNFVSKQLGSRLSVTINGSRNCYVTVKKFALVSVEIILSRTIHISNNILNWFWLLFKNLNPLGNRQKIGICLIFKGILRTWHTDKLCGHWYSLLPKDWSLLCKQSLPERLVFGQNASALRIIVLLSYPQSGVNALSIVIALNYFTVVCNLMSVIVEMVNFPMVKVENFCKNKLIAV